MHLPLSTLHMLGRFDDPYAGADRNLLELRAALDSRRTVRLWSDGPAHAFYRRQGVQAINVAQGQFPKQGMLLISGVHIQVDEWLRHAKLDRLAVSYNLPNHGALFAMLARLEDLCPLESEILFVSPALQASVGLPGRVEPSLIDLEPYLQIPLRPTRQPVTVGRLSRDAIEKHHPQDASLYRMLAARGVRVRVMGGTCLGPAIGNVPGVELLAAGAENNTDFLSSLDVFFYRTGSFYEAYGRVIFEAMASGLPLVASAHGGYSAWVHGDNGVALVENQEQAVSNLLDLCQVPATRLTMGQKARHHADQLHGPSAQLAVLQNYLR